MISVGSAVPSIFIVYTILYSIQSHLRLNRLSFYKYVSVVGIGRHLSTAKMVQKWDR